jgi:hypothetical protein
MDPVKIAILASLGAVTGIVHERHLRIRIDIINFLDDLHGVAQQDLQARKEVILYGGNPCLEVRDFEDLNILQFKDYVVY